MDDTDRLLLAELAATWNAIEGRAKDVEHFRGEMIVACINEMRYAGRRIVDVVAQMQTDRDDPQFDTHATLLAAKDHLLHADHDLTDAVIFFAHARLLRTLNRHGRKKVERYVPDYAALHPQIREAQKIVRGSREERKSRRDEYARLARDYLPQIIRLHDAIEECEKLKIESNVLVWWIRINTWLTVAASLASIAGLVAGLYGLYLIFNPPTL